MDNFLCGGYIFTSNFDSGNLHKVELVKRDEEILGVTNPPAHLEFNLWTKPDCAGTEYENLNRSWFFFYVQGGEPNKICKFNVVNLNKQAKLFSQGMHIVVRIGETGKWERIKESPTYCINDGDFLISFFHKPQNLITEKFYYAFTFPFTYTECQNQLDRFDSLYSKSNEELQFYIEKLNGAQPKEAEDQRDVNDNCHTEQNQMENTQLENTSMSVDYSNLNHLSIDEIENEIYFHRELLIKSVEGRRIDLLTITSFNGIQYEKEYRFSDLFPEQATSRCQLFRDKKIIFISSRVHPGETPSSFVLNGFLKMILDKKSRYATVLRKMYVFKIVPFLNPDGVYNGCYRSDTLGQNLNRVYLSPRIDTQPSIYAVRKLIRYYHNENDIEGSPPCIPSSETVINVTVDKNGNDTTCDNSDSNSTALSNSVSEEPSNHLNTVTSVKLIIENASDPSNINNIQSTSSSISASASSSSPSTRSPSLETDVTDSNMISVSTPSTSFGKSSKSVEEEEEEEVEKLGSASKSITVFCDELVTELKQTIIHNPLPTYAKENGTEGLNVMKRRIKVKKIALKSTSSSHLTATNLLWPVSASENSSSSSACGSARSVNDKKKENQVIFKTKNNNGNKIGAVANKARKALLNTKNTVDNNSNRNASVSQYRNKSVLGINNNNINISSDFLPKIDLSKCKSDNDGNNSNMFLYIDLHGHASKKGIFMYGNHLPNMAEAVECMLLPRLMSMNCHHFHFDACVFSERNMYHKGKRDGLSKEGSGRVAIYKAIGLIKSYTLESNYNTGKYVNVLPPRGKEQTARKVNQNPPKYTPAIFEEVGRALGPSILDLTDSNPLSRVQNSEFRSLQGLRISLRNEIEKSFPHSVNHSKVLGTQSKLRYLKSTTACCSSLTSDVSKENKGKILVNKQQTTITFAKKEKINSTRKKGKVLCDVMTASTSKQAEKLPMQPIPTKRPKVLSIAKKSAIEEVISTDQNLDCVTDIVKETSSSTINLDPTKLADNEDKALPLLYEATANNLETNVTISDAVDVKRIRNTKSTFSDITSQIQSPTSSTASIFDQDKPCCSYNLVPASSNIRSNSISVNSNILSSVGSLNYPVKFKKAGSFAGFSSAPNSLILSQTTVMHNKKRKTGTALKLKSSFNTTGAANAINNPVILKSAKRGNLIKDRTKLKKKKTLKADSTLKRKKSKVF